MGQLAGTASTAMGTCAGGLCVHPIDDSREDSAAPRVAETRLLYVTDPLCSGCWALEPAWRRLLYRYGREIPVSYVYGGLLPSWEGFHDPGARIAAAADVAPHWAAVSRASGQPIEPAVWLVDPPHSSFPASVAAAAVRLAAPEQEGAYLRRLRELVFLEQRNIARWTVLRGALRSIAIDGARWQAMIDTGAAAAVFDYDRVLVRSLGVRAFPTILADSGAGRPRLLATGSLGPEELETEVLAAIDVSSAPRPSSAAADVLNAYQTGTSVELAAALGLSVPEAERELTRAGGKRRAVAGGTVWAR